MLKRMIPKTCLLLVLFAGSFLVSSCEKDEDASPSLGDSAFPVPDYPQPADADGILVAIRAGVPAPVDMPAVPGMPAGGTVEFQYGMGVALFKGNAKAEKVVLNEVELKFVNGVHIWQPDYSNLTNPANLTGIDFSSGANWQVTNPTFQQAAGNLPGMPKITSGKAVTRSSGYTITNQPVGNAQKVLYGIYSSNGKYVHKEAAGNSAQLSFSAEELASLGATKQGIIQANAYTITDKTIDGKKIYFVRQSSYSLTGVEIK